MPYKDPVQAKLQRQRWAETHSDYTRKSATRCERRNKRWLSAKRKRYMQRWRKANKCKTQAYSLRQRIYNSENHQASKQRDYRRHKEAYKKRSKAYYKKHKKSLLAWQKQYRKENRARYNELSRKRYWKNLQASRLKSRKHALASYYRHLEENQARARAREARRRHQKQQTCEDLRAVVDFIKRLRKQRGILCSYCHRPISGQDIHIDHYIPLIKEGRHCVANLRPACGFCNRSKHDLMPDEWLERLKTLRNRIIKCHS